jgi:hypothetical protein
LHQTAIFGAIGGKVQESLDSLHSSQSSAVDRRQARLVRTPFCRDSGHSVAMGFM